nr:hypothetical protein CFP56_22043 [Quercus suber]
MTQRGRPNAGPRSVTPPDSTLQSRPVPRLRQYTPRLFGPGAVATLRDVVSPIDLRDRSHDEVLRLLQRHHSAVTTSWRADGSLNPDPSWGFYIFRTTYSDDITDDLMVRALENLVKVQERVLRMYEQSNYAEEAFRRLKFSLIECRDTLADASNDRVREEFKAVVRSLQLADNEDDFPPPARNSACMTLDYAMVHTLATLDISGDAQQKFVRSRSIKVRLIDINWIRPKSEPPSWTHAGPGYRGVMDVSITSLLDVYSNLTHDQGYLMDLHPTSEPS